MWKRLAGAVTAAVVLAVGVADRAVQEESHTWDDTGYSYEFDLSKGITSADVYADDTKMVTVRFNRPLPPVPELIERMLAVEIVADCVTGNSEGWTPGQFEQACKVEQNMATWRSYALD